MSRVHHNTRLPGWKPELQAPRGPVAQARDPDRRPQGGVSPREAPCTRAGSVARNLVGQMTGSHKTDGMSQRRTSRGGLGEGLGLAPLQASHRVRA
jgi:hypothetical protein